jgi:hypothetical protein
MKFPFDETELVEIVKSNAPDIQDWNAEILTAAIQAFKQVRGVAEAMKMQLPATDELIDWTRILYLKNETTEALKADPKNPMPHLLSWVHVLPLTVGILTSCTSLVTTYDRLRASLSEPEKDDTIHRYGAWFITPSNFEKRPIPGANPATQAGTASDFLNAATTGS